MKVVAVFLLLSIVGSSQSGHVSTLLEENYSSIVDNVVKNLLESLKGFLKNVTLPNINDNFVGPNFNITADLRNIVLDKGADFDVPFLKTSLLPIAIKNLTLVWKEIALSADYDLNGTVTLDEAREATDVFGNGKASITLNDLFLTGAMQFEFVNGKLQIPEGGLSNLDVAVSKAKVTLGDLMGNPDLGIALGNLLGGAIPDLIANLKKTVFDLLDDVLIGLLNGILAG